MTFCYRHAGALTKFTVSKLTSMRHRNGNEVCTLYGEHYKLVGRDQVLQSGAPVSPSGINMSWRFGEAVKKVEVLVDPTFQLHFCVMCDRRTGATYVNRVRLLRSTSKDQMDHGLAIMKLKD